MHRPREWKYLYRFRLAKYNNSCSWCLLRDRGEHDVAIQWGQPNRLHLFGFRLYVFRPRRCEDWNQRWQYDDDVLLAFRMRRQAHDAAYDVQLFRPNALEQLELRPTNTFLRDLRERRRCLCTLFQREQ